ncbi:MAG TPA: nucleotide exchange factor GrpE [Candidatus Avalokitesvara rifleensis]|uniref:nucleotide exchange factor GrpE n=1 Tax=Candidatus Avalokitesvara rifleensis TaxID=3367620 RepID=UPI0040293250
MTEEEKEERTAGTEEAAAEKSPQPEGAPKEEAAEAPGEKKVELTEKEYAELRKKAEERDEYLNMFLRAKADFQNYQKRARKEMEALNHLAVQDVMRALLPILDNLYRAVKSVGKPDTQSLEKFLHGVVLTQDQFLKVLTGFGVKVVHGQEGQAFNPELHEAIMEVENDKLPHHTVLEEIEQGFFLNDKVLRPAKVKVSKRTAAKAGEGAAAEGKDRPAKGVAETTEDTAKVSPKTAQGLDTGPVLGEEEPVI